jgi:hypothetical protein
MPGQIIPRGENTWLVRVYTGRDPQTGKRIYKNKTIHGAKKDAQKYLNGAVRDRDLGIYATSPTDTVIGRLLDGLVADYETNGQCDDWASLVVRVHLRPFFGGMKAAQLCTDHIQSYIAKRRQPSTRTLGKTARLEISNRPQTQQSIANSHSFAGRSIWA